jgi:hypothetical protein
LCGPQNQEAKDKKRKAEEEREAKRMAAEEAAAAAMAREAEAAKAQITKKQNSPCMKLYIVNILGH